MSAEETKTFVKFEWRMHRESGEKANVTGRAAYYSSNLLEDTLQGFSF